ncbi:hypothetical protein FN846DRAFT_911642 [Sphaerosporella brunnea]|uniref:Major facilitator superfamily (MFS) profile domain-containing protein n=1 Tax=Sphaerosporella brunnea TaxID=1250544 RepID=A0A5J5EKN6_9PEZI|nr:hypothetical protein FN846DRAFT_911642 [Sphaerosporella brunnea]
MPPKRRSGREGLQITDSRRGTPTTYFFILEGIKQTQAFAITSIMFALQNPDQGNLGPKVGFVFGSLSLVSLLFVFLLVPKMKGRSFDELDYMFQHRIPARRFKGFVVPVEVPVETPGPGEKSPGVKKQPTMAFSTEFVKD